MALGARREGTVLVVCAVGGCGWASWVDCCVGGFKLLCCGGCKMDPFFLAQERVVVGSDALCPAVFRTLFFVSFSNSVSSIRFPSRDYGAVENPILDSPFSFTLELTPYTPSSFSPPPVFFSPF